MADEKAVVQVTGDVGGVTAAFTQVEKKAAQTGKAVEGSFARAAKSIQSNQMISQMETVSALFIQMGGNVSRFASITTSLIRPVATLNALLGGVAASTVAFGVAMAALPATAAGAVALAKALANSALEARDRLIEAGRAGEIPQESLESMYRYEAAVAHLNETLDKNKIALGTIMIDDLTRLTTVLDIVSGGTDGLRDHTKELIRTFLVFDTTANIVIGTLEKLETASDAGRSAIVRFSEYIITGGALPALDSFKNRIEGLIDTETAHNVSLQAMAEVTKSQAKIEEAAAKNNAAATEDAYDRIGKAGEKLDRDEARRRAKALADEEEAFRKGAAFYDQNVRERLKIQEDADRKAAIENERANKESHDAALRRSQMLIANEEAITENAAKEAEKRRKIAAKISQYQYDLAKTLDEYKGAQAEAEAVGLVALHNLEAATNDYSGSLEQMVDAFKESVQIWGPFVDAAEEAFGNLISYMEQEEEIDRDLHDKKVDRLNDLYNMRSDLAERLKDASSQDSRDAIAADLAETNAKIANVRAQEKAYREQAYDAWKRNRGLQIAQNILNQQAAFGMTLANTSIPYPWNMLAAGTAATAVATGLFSILSAPPPEFPTGRSPDHSEVVALQPGEPVLSRRATASLGGVDAVRALNEGRGAMGGGSVTLEMSPELRRWFNVQRNPRLGKGKRR